MMKRDLKEYKYVGGAKVKNKPYQNKFNKHQNYLQRDINDVRLAQWENKMILSERQPIDLYHKESNSHKEFQDTKKMNLEQDQFKNRDNKQYKPSIALVNPPESKCEYENNFYQPKKIRQIPQISQETDIYNQAQHELPSMRTKTPTGQLKINRPKIYEPSDELKQMYQKELLPHMRDISPNGRQISNPVQHVLTNQTDFINQKKHLLPSFQDIPKSHIKAPHVMHKSQFEIRWEE